MGEPCSKSKTFDRFNELRIEKGEPEVTQNEARINSRGMWT